MSVAYPNHDYTRTRISCLYVPYSPDKSSYIKSYIKQHELYNFVVFNNATDEFKIRIPDWLSTYVSNWFVGKEKIFKRNFIKDNDYQAIMIFINLFGHRQIEGIAIPTSVSPRYLFTLLFSVSHNLKIKTMISNKQIKILDRKELFLNTLSRATTLDSSHIANFLLKKEKQIIQESLDKLAKRQRSGIYA
ncbi:hypothetical protein [Oceanobacillus luteolus]